MSAPANLDIPFLTEHFKYTPIALLDDIINSVNIIASRAVEAVEKGLLEADPAVLGFKTGSLPESVQTEIEDGVHKLETLLEATIDKNFDIFELYSLRNMLSVPADLRPWVRLNHYEGLNFNLSEDAPTTESTMLLRKKVQETVRLHLHLLAETRKRAALIQELRALTSSNPTDGNIVPKIEPSESGSPPTAGPFAFLHDKGDLGKSGVNNTTAFALAQLPGLRKLTTDLRPKMTQLNKEGAAVGGSKARRERVDYVEKETKKILERQGLELDEQGAVRDGEWQGPGRKFAESEVEALEAVVGLIGGEIGKNGTKTEVEDRMDEST